MPLPKNNQNLMMPRTRRGIIKEDDEGEGLNTRMASIRSRRPLTRSALKGTIKTVKEAAPVTGKCENANGILNEPPDRNIKRRLGLRKVKDSLPPSSISEAKVQKINQITRKGKKYNSDDSCSVRPPMRLRCRNIAANLSKDDTSSSKSYKDADSEISLAFVTNPAIEKKSEISDSTDNIILYKQSSSKKKRKEKGDIDFRICPLSLSTLDENRCKLSDSVVNVPHKKSIVAEKLKKKEKLNTNRNQHEFITSVENESKLHGSCEHKSLHKKYRIEKSSKKKNNLKIDVRDKENTLPDALHETPSFEKFDRSLLRSSSIEFHSTPSIDKLDDSLFGFNLIGRVPTPIDDFSNISMSSTMTITDAKRQVLKRELAEEILLDTIPKEEKKRRQKKKKPPKKKSIDELDEILGQFEEAAMHDLVIE